MKKPGQSSSGEAAIFGLVPRVSMPPCMSDVAALAAYGMAPAAEAAEGYFTPCGRHHR